MPLRPDLPTGLNLSRRAQTPVKLPKMNFPMMGGLVDQNAQAGDQVEEETAATATPPSLTMQAIQSMPAMQAMPGMQAAPAYPAAAPVMAAQPAPAAPQPAPQPALPVAQATRVLVYGRSNCQACMDAIQDLMQRGMSFTYYDVAKDAKAMQYVQAICGAEAMVPIIIQVGFNGA